MTHTSGHTQACAKGRKMFEIAVLYESTTFAYVFNIYHKFFVATNSYISYFDISYTTISFQDL